MKTAPMQGHEPIPWALHLRIYEAYAKKWGRQQTAERLAERGGFTVAEADELRPGWRADCEELAGLRLRVEEQRVAIRDLMNLAGKLDEFRVEGEALEQEVARLREALDVVWAAIGDALCSGEGISKEYGQSVAAQVAAALREGK